ncbi:phage tail spike protein [Staphylococcus haemolyticus]|uniref:phage tail spike protein n=1 Tax=Staphylococcus haemolyticus TaxID=1283 RepID=UPI00115EC94D|nr:phage tail spike protein [Staphylococcus haemolyticus]TRL69761.1 hypothetical protein FNL07_02805 [Staphylococcus haemolyticus]
MIHVLNHNSEIIDFISRSDNVVIHSEYKREKENNSELLDLTILSSRAKHFKENNRIIIQDKSNQYREFIIQHIEDSGQYIDVEATASYIIDIGTAKPIPAGKYEKMSVTQKLDEVLRDTDWVTGDCDYGGVRTNSWASVRTPYEMISQLETSHELESDFEIIIEGNEVVERRVNMKKPNSLFKGKEIEYGKDLTEMKRTVDFSEVVTALFAFGPEDNKGNRISLVVTDDEAQEQFGLPTRYIWGIYEPESDDENMTADRLKTLARTELNKRKSATVSYEISTFDIEKQFPHEVIRFGDTVRIKNSDFVPSLYAESEVIGFTHDLISDDIVYTFGNVVEYAEDDLLKYFKGKLNEINQKLNDNITNINTIVNDAVAGELEYYERKIFKGTEPPENPQNDMLWYDTSNPDVAVLRRYWNGKWITQTADDVEKIGGLRREQVMYRDLNNSFINLTIQHSKLQNDVYDVLNSEYLVDDDLKSNLNQALLDLDSVYQNIKANLNSMDEETATIGKLVDTQTLFTVYREKLQTLYKYVTDAKISIDRRLKLLQSQYTDEKFNDAMDKIAQTLPNGRWDSENQQLYADIPNEQELSNLKQTLQDYYDGNIKELEGRLNNSVDSKVKVAKDEISANVKSVESRINGVQTRVDTTESNISALKGQISLMAKSDDVAQKLRDVDGRLTPLETTVESNKATLDILPTQIDSKVSKQDYTLDKDNIVQRLNNADSERKQLSNEITDKVTLTKFESGMTEAKNYTDNIKKETENYTDNQINNLDIGSENLLLDSERRSDGSKGEGFSYIRYYLSHPLEVGKTYTLKADIVTTDERQSGRTSVYPYNPSGTRDTVDIKDGKITYTFTAKVESTEFLIYKDVAGQSNVDLDVTIEKAILVEGDKVTGWAPANEDVKKDIQQAEANAKNYTDDYKRSNDVAMTKLETSITQNGDKIALKVDEQKFNASQKTLSQVISEISATTKGINLSYDENGNIQSYTMDRNGIKIDGSKIDINQGDVVIQNGVTTIKDAYIDKLFSKNATIQYLNSIDITAKRLQAVDNGANVDIENGTITMTRSSGEKLNLGIDGISMYNSNGSERFSINKTLVTSAALGTSNANVYLGAGSDYEARVVDVSYLPSDGYIDSYVYRPLRASGFYGNFWNINTADTLGNPVNLYARPVSGGELRVVLNGTRSNYQNFRADGIYGNWFDVNKLQGNSSNLFIRPASDGELRVTESGSTSKYRPVRASHFMLEDEGIGDNTPNNSYLGTNKEWRFTSNAFYNKGDTVYKDIRFRNWNAMSSERFKYDIDEWNYSVLDAYRNDLQLYKYKNKSEKDDDYTRYHHGIIIEREIPIEWRNGDGFDGNEVLFWNTKAIQELIFIVDEQSKQIQKLEEQLNEQSISN